MQTGLLTLFENCENLSANTVRRPLSLPLSAKWPAALATRSGGDVLEMDLTYQVSRTFESKRHIVTLADVYDTNEVKELVKHSKAKKTGGYFSCLSAE